jgi:hypothetical protein
MKLQIENEEELEEQHSIDPWSLYLYAMKSPVTREKYTGRLSKFLEHVGLEGKNVEEQAKEFVRKSNSKKNWAFNIIVKFLQLQTDRFNRREISASTVRNYMKAIKLFCEMADIPIAWKKITRGLPKERKYVDDRVPTIDELQKLVQYPDRRIKAIVYTMASSGARLGFWDYLRWGDIKPIEHNGKIVAAKMSVYAREEDEYYTFIVPSALELLQEWMNFRESKGEPINEESWVMRDLWDTSVAQGRGLVTKPKKLTSTGIKRLINRALWAQGLRYKLKEGKKRHPYQAIHSLRKWFKTRCELSGMKPINIETLLSHSTGISDSYYRPTENDLLEDYLRSVECLTIDSAKVQSKRVEGESSMKDDAIASLSDKLMTVMTRLEKLEKGQTTDDRSLQILGNVK